MDVFGRIAELVGDALLPDDVREPLGRARAHLVHGRYAEAEREALAVLERRKDLPSAHLVLGLARRGLGDVEGARAALREALRRGPGEPTAHLALAECELALGDAARAVREAKLARDAGGPAAESTLVLARAHLARGERNPAREALEALPAAQRPLEALVLLGDLRLEGGDAPAAQALYEQALARGLPTPEALAGLARALFAQGRTEDAFPKALRALSEAPADARLSALVGALHEARGNHAAALVAYERALEHDPRSLDALRGAARAALAERDGARAWGYYRRVLEQEPEDADARAGVARIELEERLREERARYDRSADAEARLGLRPDALYGLLVRTHRLFAAAPELGELAERAAALRDGYDRPLLLAIAGEFNAGKSTLLNALLGDAVAPMGVTPTTAAVNVFVYGTRRAARVVLRDGSASEVNLADVPSFIDRRRGAGDASVQYVEMIWPAEPLREVSLVDTPGFNAAEEEHEQVARAFLSRADAVLWIFDAAHAGSASERSAIEALGPLRGKVVGVLNKADRLAPDDLRQVLAHVEQSFAGEVERWVAVSAREALEGRRAQEPARVAESGFGSLWALLESRFFARARAAKLEATRARASVLIAEARARAEPALRSAAEAAERAASRSEGARVLSQILARDLVPSLEEAHRIGMRRILLDTSREALEVARRRPAGLTSLLSPRVAEADLDFLGRVLADRLHTHVDELWRRAVAEVERLGRAELDAWRNAPERAEAGMETLLALAARAVHEAGDDLSLGPFGCAKAYVRGFVESGGLRAVAAPLARVADADGAERVLERAVPRTLPWREPLLAWVRGFGRVFEDLATEALRAAEAKRAELEWRTGAPLAEIERALGGGAA